MPSFLVEIYAPALGRDAFDELIADTQSAVDRVTHEGSTVRLVHSICVPEDETCFFTLRRPFRRSSSAYRPTSRTAEQDTERHGETNYRPERGTVMKRIVITAAVALAALLGPAATAAAAPNPSAGCVGQFSSFFAHGDAPHRSDVARDFAANARPAGRNVYSHVAEFHGTLESCFDQT